MPVHKNGLVRSLFSILGIGAAFGGGLAADAKLAQAEGALAFDATTMEVLSIASTTEVCSAGLYQCPGVSGDTVGSRKN